MLIHFLHSDFTWVSSCPLRPRLSSPKTLPCFWTPLFFHELPRGHGASAPPAAQVNGAQVATAPRSQCPSYSPSFTLVHFCVAWDLLMHILTWGTVMALQGHGKEEGLPARSISAWHSAQCSLTP